MMPADRRVAIAGAGLAGGLLGLLLARRGWSVDLFERLPDPRHHGFTGGRSINMALAERGLHALRAAGLEREVLHRAVMMRGRMVHPIAGEPQLLRYGRDDREVIWSIHRGTLSTTLLDCAEAAGARVHFAQRVDSVDLDARRLLLTDDEGVSRPHDFDVVLGCDGAGSVVRTALGTRVDLGERFELLEHGYKELTIPPAEGGFRIDGNALHIWPRGGYMCIALPNVDRSFTVTLFLPNEGRPGFAELNDVAAARAFFARELPDALPLLGDFERQWTSSPVGMMGTLRLARWHFDDRALLLGDAAHAMVPFHGQGMNCAFEDCTTLDRYLDEYADLGDAFAAFEHDRQPNADAIQNMALENYVEMRDSVSSPEFLLQRAVERALAERHPGHFVPRYAMVTFTRIPYAVALERGQVQRAILSDVTRGCRAIEDVDLARADALVRERLAPLPVGVAGGVVPDLRDSAAIPLRGARL